MPALRFIHAADLHLDAPFRGLSLESKELGHKLRQASFQALENLVQLCLQLQVDFLLISGDVYNQEDRNLRCQLRFRDALARLGEQGIAVYMVHGNHDPAGSTAQTIQWPENVHVFTADTPAVVPFVRGDQTLALIHGASHTRAREARNLARKFQRSPGDILQIGLLHCNLGRNTGHESYAPCELQDLFSTDLDYWALGHVHSAAIMSRDPYVVYPGNIQGLNINEQGKRGCYVVDVQPGPSLEPCFHCLDAVRWAAVEVDIQDLSSVDQLENSILQALQAQQEQARDRGLICRVILRGRGGLHQILNSEDRQDELLQRLREHYIDMEPILWIKDLRLETAADLDLESRRRQGDFLGQVLAQEEKFLEHEDRLQYVQKDVLAELFQHRRARHFLKQLSQAEADALLHRAKMLCVDLLDSADNSNPN